MELARQYGISRFPTPGGGCLLTDPGFSARLRDLFQREARWDVRDLWLLSVGRHLRILPDRKIVVGRNERENLRLISLAEPEDLLLSALEHPGPVVILPHGGISSLVERAAAVCLRYGDAPRGSAHPVMVRGGAEEWIVRAEPCAPDETDRWLIGP
jgi:hypothetical protein